MKSLQVRLLLLAAALGTAAALSACHDNNQTAAPTAPSNTQNFSAFATATFKASANSTPVNFDSINLVYDVNEDPTAFDALLM